MTLVFFFSSRRRHTRYWRDWSSDVCSSDLRVPVPIFFAAITFFFALIPAVGAAVVCLAAALLLLATGHPVAALVLAVWGVVVVGLSDNVIKPILAKRGMHMHGAIVFFSLLGGLSVFGAIGLLLGPLIVAFFL